LSIYFLALKSVPICLSSFIAPMRPLKQICIFMYSLTAAC
jgi:hypothetical protein